jgi:hypothetical protein
MVDAQHIAIATVNRVDILVSWNFRHIVNLTRFSVKREYAPTASHAGTTYLTLIKRPSLNRMVILDNTQVFCDDKKDGYCNSPKVGI